MDSVIEEMQGKELFIQLFSVENCGNSFEIKMKCTDKKGGLYSVVFKNASKINIKEVSLPFQICGFEIIDNTARGYQSDCRYFVNDYEDGRLSFNCEEILTLGTK